MDGSTAADVACVPHSREAARAHWAGIARRWAQLGPPLRPSPQDVAFYRQTVAAWSLEHDRAPRALILGVTPELYDLPWPRGSSVIAIDQAVEMIRAVWPGPLANVACGDWTAPPLPDASRDVVFCDGGLLLLPYPDGLSSLARSLARIVAAGGRCAFRLFVPPIVHETVDDVLRDLFDGRVANLNLLKVRLWMALHDDPAEGVPLRRVWQALNDAAPDLHALAARLGWPAEHLLAINAYRDSSACYHLIGEADVRRTFCDGPVRGFALAEVLLPDYELGAWCPTVVLRRAGSYDSTCG